MLDELILLSFRPKRVFLESLENLPYMGDMFVPCLTEGEDIIQVDNDKDVKEVLESIVDQILERSGSVGETKGHDVVFEETISGAECCIPLITRLDSDEVVSSSEINLCEP